jgi:hypothetical protein
VVKTGKKSLENREDTIEVAKPSIFVGESDTVL